jgi:nucleotide-binding universal stress UspA family protein
VHPSFAASTVPLTLRRPSRWPREPARIPYAAAAPFGGMAGNYAVMEEVESQEEAAERLLEHVVVAAGLIDAERRAAVGVPAERLADLADEEDAELIVVGSRGRGAVKSAFLGSVSNRLVGVARCPVELLRSLFEDKLDSREPEAA